MRQQDVRPGDPARSRRARRTVVRLVALAGAAALALATGVPPSSGTGAADSPAGRRSRRRPRRPRRPAPGRPGHPDPDRDRAPAGDRPSYPFGAAAHQRVPEDLARFGYVEQEYLVSGGANVYHWPAPGPAVVRTPDVPYTTRVLVRRPADSKDVRGAVVGEMLNPSNVYDLNIGWALSHEQFLRKGDVWVGITAKPVTVAALETFDPQRYASLSMANPLPLDDPANCATPNTIIADDSSQATENGLIWDFNRQVGAWLWSPVATNPLTYGTGAKTQSPVRHLYGFGYSQTGGYLYTYINAIAPLDVAANGAPLYDGYVVGVAGGAFAGTVPINQCAPSIPVGDPRNSIHDAGVPVIHIMSQSDYLLGIASRRPDSDVPEDIVRAGRTIPSLTCGDGPRSRFPSSLVFGAALQNLDLWVRKGIAPPHADPIAVVDGKGVVDQFGNLVGGYRTPLLEVPTTTWFGSSSGGGFCFIAGHEEPFDAARLRQLYGSHQAYVHAVIGSAKALQAARLLTGPDARALIEQARRSGIPPRR